MHRHGVATHAARLIKATFVYKEIPTLPLSYHLGYIKTLLNFSPLNSSYSLPPYKQKLVDTNSIAVPTMKRNQIEALLEDRRKYDVKEMQKCVSSPFDVALALAYVQKLHKTFKESALQIDLRPFPNPARFSPQCLIQPWVDLYEPLINKLHKRNGISTPFMPYFLAALDGHRCSESCSVLSAYDANPLELYHTFAAMDPELKGQFDKSEHKYLSSMKKLELWSKDDSKRCSTKMLRISKIHKEITSYRELLTTLTHPGSDRTRAAMGMYFKHTTNFSNYVNALSGINVIEQPPRDSLPEFSDASMCSTASTSSSAGDVIFVSNTTDSAIEETWPRYTPDLPRISSRVLDGILKIPPCKPEIKEHIDDSECRPLNYREEVTNEHCKTSLQLSWPLISVEKLIAYLGAGKIQDDGPFYIRAADSFSTLWRRVLVYCLS